MDDTTTIRLTSFADLEDEPAESRAILKVNQGYGPEQWWDAARMALDTCPLELREVVESVHGERTRILSAERADACWAWAAALPGFAWQRGREDGDTALLRDDLAGLDAEDIAALEAEDAAAEEVSP